MSSILFFKNEFGPDGRRLTEEPVFEPSYPNGTRQSLDEEWKNIRIKLNYDYITGKERDYYTCYEVGQVIPFSWYNITCKESDLITNKNLTEFYKTIDNLIEFTQKFIKVRPTPNKDYDYKLTIYISYFEVFSSVLAQGGYSGYDEYHRPTSGHIEFNNAYVSNKESKFNSSSSYFIHVAFHELTHALGSFHINYHELNSTKLWDYNQTHCKMTKYGKNFTFLISPNSHKFAVKHYGVETFEGDDNDCPSGIEIEDGGGSGTMGSHLKASKFNSDLNVGMTLEIEGYDYERITDATIAILQDTGNYICNWSMAQPLVWGNPESQIGGKPIKDFAIGPPQLVYPLSYQYRSDYIYKNVGFDFKHIGTSLQTFKPKDCQNSDTKYCKGINFYNPLNWTYVGNQEIFDYMWIRFPQVSCPRGKAVLPGLSYYYYYPEECGEYKCNKYDNFTFYVVNSTWIDNQPLNITCNRTTVNQSFNYTMHTSGGGGWGTYKRTAYCVDPELFCRTVKLSEMTFVRDPLDPDSKQLDDPYAKPHSQVVLELTIASIVTGITFIVIFVIIGFIIFYKCRESKGDYSGDGNDDNQETRDIESPPTKENQDIEKDSSEPNYLSD